MSKRAIGILALIMATAILATGCCFKGGSGCPLRSKQTQLCTDCGEIKGGGQCCKKDAAKCAKCKLAKGSPGCCKK